MISLNNIGSAADALHYFTHDNYYTQEEGLAQSQWWGEAASRLGLSGQIDKEAFFRLLEGKVGEQELGRYERNDQGVMQRQHRPGTDMTFSAPKSVSLLAEVAGNLKVRTAHEKAVNTVLAFVEKELTGTRITTAGNTQWVNTGNLAVALFRHTTSRDLDPQTHTHAVILNLTERQDGQWASIVNDFLYENQRLLGAMYNAELATELKGLGFGVYRTDERGNFEIEGISREHVEAFSQRRAAIIEYLAEKGIAIDEATSQQKEDATLKTRDRKVEVDHDLLQAHWKQQASELALDLDTIAANAKTNRLSREPALPSSMDEYQAMSFAANHVFEREAVASKKTLLTAAMEHGSGQVSSSEVLAAFHRLVKQGDLIVLAEGQITTKKLLANEQWSLTQMHTHKGQTTAILEAESVAQRLDTLEQGQGFLFSVGQKHAISKVLTTQDRYIAVQGLAGTGKTTMLRALKSLAEEQGYTLRGMAPTGAASKVLALETGIASDTVSMFQIKAHQSIKDCEARQQSDSQFSRAPELWVIDESSFLSQRQKNQLDRLAEQAGAKVVYLGDTLQLQGVEAGKPFELAQRHGIDTAYMTEINRQKTSVLKEAVDIIVDRSALDTAPLPTVQLTHNKHAFEYLDKHGCIHEVREDEKNTALVTALVNDYLSLSRDDQLSTLLITAYNEDRHVINQAVRNGLKSQGVLSGKETEHTILISKGWTRAQQKEAQYYTAGDIVRFGRDYQTLGVAKGETLTVKSVDALAGKVELQKADGSTVSWSPHQQSKVEVYESDNRLLMVGDAIRFTRNERDIKNGEIAKICTLEGNTAVVEMGHGSSATRFELNLAQDRHWDYGYATTVHSAQGSTKYRTYFHIRTPIAADAYQQKKAFQDMANVFGDRSFYVGVTRASHELKIYTNDKDTAAKAVGIKQDKTSALESTLARQSQKASQMYHVMER